MTDWYVLTQNLMAAGVARGTPILYASLGELFSERAGVINLGMEGIMLMGAVSGVAVALSTGSPYLGLSAGVAAGAMLAFLHAFVCITLRGNQIVSGLSIVFLGTGLASVLGAPLIDIQSPIPRFETIPIPYLSDISILGPIFFEHNLLVYLALLAVLLIHFWLFKTGPGLKLRACGENPEAVASMGISVTAIRYYALILGGALGGLGGAMLSLAVTPGWVDGMVSGQGWIAIGLVIFAGWNPFKAAFGAFLFGMIRRLPLDLQGTDIPFFQNPNLGYFLNMLPYLVTILVLVIASKKFSKKNLQPAALGDNTAP